MVISTCFEKEGKGIPYALNWASNINQAITFLILTRNLDNNPPLALLKQSKSL